MAIIRISLSKAKSKARSKNPRSAFLSAFMSELSKDGSIVEAFFGKDKKSLETKLDSLKGKLVSKMPNLEKD